MLILGIETATPKLSAALIDTQNHIQTERSTSARSSHCELISGFIQELLDETKHVISDIDTIAVSIGPGSFTGLRIGIATAMGLAYGLDIHTCAVSTLAGIAWQAAPKGTLVCPLIDARRREAYTSVYRLTGEATPPESIVDPTALPVEKLADMLAELNEPVVLTGPAAQLFAGAILPAIHADSYIVEPEVSEPTALSIAQLGAILADKGYTVSPHELSPVYLRRSDAEIARDTKCL